MDNSTPLARIKQYVGAASTSKAFSISKTQFTGTKDTGLVSLISNGIALTYSLIRIVLPILNYALFQIVKVATFTAIKLNTKVADVKARDREARQVFASIEPNVHKLVQEFVEAVKRDPSKAIWEQKQFQTKLIEELRDLSDEYELDLNVTKLAKTIVKQQSRVMQAAIKMAKERHGKKAKLTSDEFMASRDMSRIEQDMVEQIEEDRAYKRPNILKNRHGRY